MFIRINPATGEVKKLTSFAFSPLVFSTLLNIEILIYEINMTFSPNFWRMNITAPTWGLGVSPEADDRPEVLRFWAESDCVSVSMEELGEIKPSSWVSTEVAVVDLPSVLCLLLRPSRLLPYKIHSIKSSLVKAAVYHNFEWVKILLANIFSFA